MKIWPPARLGVASVVTVIVIKNENDIARQVVKRSPIFFFFVENLGRR